MPLNTNNYQQENGQCVIIHNYLLWIAFHLKPFGSVSGRLFGAAGEQPFIGSTLSSAFPLVNHPAFGALYTAGAGRPEFGGLGSLGMSAALAAHPQLGALSGKTGTFELWAAIG